MPTNPQDIQKIQDTIKQHPELIDDPKLRDMLKDFEKAQKDGALDKDLPKPTQEDLAKWLKAAKIVWSKPSASKCSWMGTSTWRSGRYFRWPP